MTDELKGQIEQAAEVLKQFGAKEVYVFGSAVTGEMDEYSDIDLAVSGLPAKEFFRAWSKAGDRIPRRELDLVDLDDDRPFTKYLKRKEGRLQRVG
jgi:predicted nucleotidyltransferase